MARGVHLITYADRLGGDFAGLIQLLDGPLSGLFAGLHVLPFFDPIDGADAGFDPSDHRRVDRRLGDWADVRKLAENRAVMADLVVNHISRDSPEFQAHLQDPAQHRELFLRFADVFPDGASETDLTRIYRPRPNLPFTPEKRPDGNRALYWTTFTPAQIDINVESAAGRRYLSEVLECFAAAGVTLVRLDAIGYAIKRAGTSCFMLPETFAFIESLRADAAALGLEVLVECHTHYELQLAVAASADWIYDFCLPPLMLHTLYSNNADALKHWLQLAPVNRMTVLDTHDGIGIIDVAGDGDRPGLLSPEQIQALIRTIHQRSRGASLEATGVGVGNVDIYQVNCTYYDALGRSDALYLAARTVQLLLPGLPQIYYVGLLAGANDMALLRSTGVGRDINRHYYDREEIDATLKRPLVRTLLSLIRLRAEHPAFDGAFQLDQTPSHVLALSWRNGVHQVGMTLDLISTSLVLRCSTRDGSVNAYEIGAGIDVRF